MSLFKPFKAIFGRKVETRAEEPSWAALRGVSGLSGPTGALVNPRLAENLAIATACVDRIADGVASLPVYVYRRQESGREIVDGHPLQRLVRRGPNQWQAWPDFAAWVMRQVLLWGNCLAEIVTDASGRLVELRPIPWWCVSVQLLPSGRLAYDVTEITTIYGGTGRHRRLLDYETVHLKDASDDGLVGRPRLARAAPAVSNAMALQDFQSAYFRNGARPSGVLEHPGVMSEDAANRLRRQWDAMYSGIDNTGKTMVLEESMAYKPLSSSMEDAELLDSRRFAAEEIARIFQVPPPLVGIWDNSSFTNSETAGRWFAQHTLGPWIRKLECEFGRKILSEAAQGTHEIEFDLSGLLRGDPETRWKSHQIAVSCGILTPNEIRETEGWGPRQDGDVLKQQTATLPPSGEISSDTPLSDSGTSM